MTDKVQHGIYPPTANGLSAMECLSAMQKCIRRNMEREAMEFACELLHSADGQTGRNKNWFMSLVLNRLEIVCHEDIDTMRMPEIVAYVRSCCETAREQWNPSNPAKTRMCVGNAIRMMSRAPKSREGCHFQAAVGFRSWSEGYVPEIPDWAIDQHTLRGKRLGLGMDHFRTEGCMLVPPAQPDKYEEEAYHRWDVRDGNKPSEEQGTGVLHKWKGKMPKRDAQSEELFSE